MVAKQGMREVKVAHWLLNVSATNGVMLLSLLARTQDMALPGCKVSGNVQEHVGFWRPLQTSLPQ